MNLGKNPEKGIKEATVKETTSVYYPSVHVNDVDGLEDLPEGEFKFTGTGKVVSYTESVRNGKKTCSCEIEIHSIDPVAKKVKKTKSSEESLDESFDKIAEEKSEEYED